LIEHIAEVLPNGNAFYISEDRVFFESVVQAIADTVYNIFAICPAVGNKDFHFGSSSVMNLLI
jgi:hypothetical protein